MGYSVMDIRPVTSSHNFTVIISTPFSTVNSTSPLCRLNKNIASSASIRMFNVDVTLVFSCDKQLKKWVHLYSVCA